MSGSLRAPGGRPRKNGRPATGDGVSVIGDRDPPTGRHPAGSDRRWLGVAILVGLVALTIAVAADRSPVVAGQAVAAPVPGPPQAGDCLLEDPFGGTDTYIVGSSPLPSLRTAGCRGDRHGEVVSVGTGTGPDVDGVDAAFQQCWDSAAAYLGLPEPATSGWSHFPMLAMGAVVIGPDDRQRAAGQDWSACVVHLSPLPWPGSIRSVDHSLRDAWDRAEDGGLFAICRPGTSPSEFVSCHQPHAFEMVSSWPGDPVVSDESNRESCRRDAAEWLGAPAALDRGELTTKVQYFRWVAGFADVQIVGPEQVSDDGETGVECVLTPADRSRLLIGPLRGLGTAPVPLR
jgi:hypothetical protein